MCHQDELKAQLSHAFTRLKPDAIGSAYMVVGTVGLKTWKAALTGEPATIEETLKDLAQIKDYRTLQFDPGGCRKADAGPRYLEPTPPDTPWRNARPRPGSPPA